MAKIELAYRLQTDLEEQIVISKDLFCKQYLAWSKNSRAPRNAKKS